MADNRPYYLLTSRRAWPDPYYISILGLRYLAKQFLQYAMPSQTATGNSVISELQQSHKMSLSGTSITVFELWGDKISIFLFFKLSFSHHSISMPSTFIQPPSHAFITDVPTINYVICWILFADVTGRYEATQQQTHIVVFVKYLFANK